MRDSVKLFKLAYDPDVIFAQDFHKFYDPYGLWPLDRKKSDEERDKERDEMQKELLKTFSLEELHDLLMSDVVGKLGKEMAMAEVLRTLSSAREFQFWFERERVCRSVIISDLRKLLVKKSEDVYVLTTDMTVSLCAKLVALDDRLKEAMGLFRQKIDKRRAYDER